MVGYYPQLQDGELLYSATARLAGAIFSGRSASYCAERILGHADLSFGFLIPNHVDGLLKNIPEITALTKEAVLEASTFYLHSPLLNKREQSALLKSVFATGSTQGLRTFSPRGAPTVRKYCVSCARRDAELGKPPIWRVVPNHHGSFACAEHGIRLQISDAPVGKNALCDPTQWIKLDVGPPIIATDAELAIAQDFAWIHAQRGTRTPGFQSVATKLRDALLTRREFTRAYGLDPAKILRAARGSLSEPALPIFASQFGQLARGRTLTPNWRTTLQVYCLYAFLAGTSLKQILTDLDREGFDATVSTERDRNGGTRLLFHKNRLEEFTKAHPGCTRSQLHADLPGSADIVLREDREWYERTMPETRSNRARGRRFYQDWPDRDDKLCAQVSQYRATSGTAPFRSVRDALQKLSQSRSLMRRAHGRLPKSRALLASLITPIQAAA
jgi:hypothetical protein